MLQTSVQLMPSMNEWVKLNQLITAFCEDHELTEEMNLDLRLVCEEWFVNIVVHGYGDEGIDESSVVPIQVELRINDRDEVVIQFQDGARAFNPMEHEEPDVQLSADERSIGGLGIYLIKKKMDSCTYRRIDNLNYFSMKKKVHSRTK